MYKGMTEKEIEKIVEDAAIALHRELKYGLLKWVYEAVLVYELEQRGLRVQRQVPLPICFNSAEFEEEFLADIIVEEKVLVNVKNVENTNYAHEKQLLKCLRLTKMKLGFVLNFNESFMQDGITRMAYTVNIKDH